MSFFLFARENRCIFTISLHSFLKVINFNLTINNVNKSCFSDMEKKKLFYRYTFRKITRFIHIST